MYHKWQLHEVWFVWSMRYGVQQTEFFVILDHFLPFYPLTTQKIKIFKIWKNPTDIIILNMCNINDNHMMYGSCDVEHDRVFVNQNYEKWKKYLAILSYTCLAKMTFIWCMVPEIWHVTRQNFLQFWAIFCPFTSLTTPKIKIS